MLKVPELTECIESGVLSDIDKAYAYLVRGDAYQLDAELARVKGEKEDMVSLYDMATNDYTQATLTYPAYPEPYRMRGILYRDIGEFDKALTDFDKAITINPNSGILFDERAHTFVQMAQIEFAYDDFRTAILLGSPNSQSHCNMAWLLATHPSTEYRNGITALELAHARVNTRGTKPKACSKRILAVAYAENGEFEQAIHESERAIKELEGGHHVWQMQEEYRELLELFRSGKPYRTEIDNIWR